jgi:cytochrome P450
LPLFAEYIRGVALPPAPTLPPPLQTLRLMARPIPLLEAARREIGDSFTIRAVPVQTMVFVSDAASIKAVFAADRVNTIAPGRNLILAPLLGPDSLLLIEGERHLQRRRLMLPPFHGDRMCAYEQVIEEATEREMERWPTGSPFPIHPSMQEVTLDVIMRAVFGVGGDRREELRRALLDILAATRSPGTIGIMVRGVRNLPHFRRVKRQIEVADQLLAAEIAQHRADPGLEQRDDILSLLISARDEEGEGMGDSELRDQLMTLLLAGHETTATGLAWAFELLLHHPEALERLRAELDEDGGGEYMEAVIEETLRLRPVIPFVGRLLKAPMTLDGYELPTGTNVFPSIYLAHTNPRIFPEPYSFRPERFLEGGGETYSWIPFGGGTRRCIGAAFAQLEMKVVLRTVLRAADLRAVSPEPQPMIRRNVTLSPRDGTPVTMSRRTVPAATGREGAPSPT